MSKSNFRDFFLSKSEKQKTEYAKKAGTTRSYIQTHLITRYKIPRKKLMEGLVDACNGAFTYEELLSFFYTDQKRQKKVA